MPDFKLVSDFQPTGDQPEAIACSWKGYAPVISTRLCLELRELAKLLLWVR